MQFQMKMIMSGKVVSNYRAIQVFEATKGGQVGVQNTDRHRTGTGQGLQMRLISVYSFLISIICVTKHKA